MIIDSSIKKKITYQFIINKINNDDFYYDNWQYATFYGFLINFLKSLVSNKDILLLDKEFSLTELKNLGFESKSSLEKKINYNANLSGTQELRDSILNSSSVISIYTSGTTGKPKRIKHSVNSLTRMTRIGEKYNSNVWGMAYNPTHMAGLQVIFQAILNLNKLVYLFDKSIKVISKEIKKYEITHLSATPTFYRMLISEGKKFKQVQRVTLGGEKSNEKLVEDLKNIFPNAKINNIYASTELGSLFVANGEIFTVPQELEDKVKVIDSELVICNELLPDKSVTEQEWFKTGDLVEVISQEPLSFKFLKRKSEKVNVGGYMVNPVEIEDLIRNIEGINDVRVFGRENSVLGNILCAEILIKENISISAKELKEILKEDLQEYKIPAIIKFTDEIKKTRTGKVMRE